MKFIFLADIHSRMSNPVCRVDDFYEAYKNKMNQVFKLSYDLNAPIFIAGDVGHHWNWPCELLNWWIQIIKSNQISVYAVAGQHDQPNHAVNLLYKSGLGVLHQVGAVKLLSNYQKINGVGVSAFGWGEELVYNDKADICIIHKQIQSSPHKPDFPGQNSPDAVALLKKYPYSLVVSGDNHITFTSSFTSLDGSKRKLVNSGSLMRSTIAQFGHKPCVFIYDTKTKEMKKHFLKITPSAKVMNMDLIKMNIGEEGEDVALEAVIETMNNVSGKSDLLNFTERLKQIVESSKISKGVKDKLWKVILKNS